ncbi:hypothetical protein L7F22_062716 [Adiantum nelumboides]|nr:hypothetical protein [Adiantum nelumboides]
MVDKGKDKLPVEESSSSTCKHRRETAAADTKFMASARTARAPRPSTTAEEQEENDLFTAQLMSMMGTFEQLAKNPRMQKLLKTKDYRTGSQAETSQQATSRQRQVTDPVERVPTVVTGPVQHVTQAQDPARNGHRSNEQFMHPTIPMHTSFPGYFGGGSVFQSMIRPSPGFQGYMPSIGNPMYDNIGVQPGFQIVPGSIGMAGTDLGMADPSRPYVRPMDLSGGTGVSPNTDIPLLKPPVYDSLTPKGKAKDYKEGGQAVKFEPFFGTTDRMKALIFLQQFDAAFTGGNFTEASKIRKAASFLKENDWVLLRFEKARLRKRKGKKRLFPKLSIRYYGPFQVSQKISDVAYRLKLPEGWKIHNAFHVSLLRPFVGEVLEEMVPEEQPEVEELDKNSIPEQILAHKDRKVKGKVARRYLVKFKNYSPMDAKWMEEAELADSPQLLQLYKEAFLLESTVT